jgi:hypothetical protein
MPEFSLLSTFTSQFKNKIAVIFFGCQERVGRTHHGCADDRTVFHFIFSLSVELLPASQVFSIEEDPASRLSIFARQPDP